MMHALKESLFPGWLGRFVRRGFTALAFLVLLIWATLALYYSSLPWASGRILYAVGDCNGYSLFTHAAMHQGMLALMNSMIPGPFKFDYRNYVIPWTVFTTPMISQVGRTRAELEKAGVRFEEVTARYEDYGAAIAENTAEGYVSAYISPYGRIFGAKIVGEGSGEMIGEWALAIQKKVRITDIMMLQHSFPTMSFLSKQVSEKWMMGKMKSKTLQAMCRFMFR